MILMAPSPPSAEILKRAEWLYSQPRLHDDFTKLGMEEPSGLFGFYLLDDAGLRKFSSGAPINTDDRTLLEYHAPRALLARGLEDKNRDAIIAQQKDPLPTDFAPTAPSARDAALAAAATTSANQDDAAGADRFLRPLDNRPVTASIALIRGRAALNHANYPSAFRAFDAALAIAPNSLEAAWGVAEADRHFGNNEKARAELERILARDPQNLRSLESLERLDADFSRWTEAEVLQRRLLAADPRPSAAARAELGEILLREDKQEEAYRAMQARLAEDPYDYQMHFDLGGLLVQQKRWQEARTHLEFVMRFYPDEDARTYPLLVQADQALGDSLAAAKALRFGLRLFPSNEELQHLNLAR
jgi:predicted Zn-dependent protease